MRGIFLFVALCHTASTWSSNDLWLKGEFDERSGAYLHMLMEKAIEKMQKKPESFKEEITVIEPNDYHMTIPYKLLNGTEFVDSFSALPAPSSPAYLAFYKGMESLKKDFNSIHFTIEHVHTSHKPGKPVHLIITLKASTDVYNKSKKTAHTPKEWFHVTVANGNIRKDDIKQDPVGKYIHALKSKIFEVLEGKKNRLFEGHLSHQDKKFIESIKKESLEKLNSACPPLHSLAIKVRDVQEYEIAVNPGFVKSNKTEHNFRPKTLPKSLQELLKAETKESSTLISFQEYKIDAARTFKDTEDITHLVLALETYTSKSKQKKTAPKSEKIELKFDPYPFIEIACSTKKCKEAACYLKQWQVTLEEALGAYPLKPLYLSHLSAYKKGGSVPIHVVE